MTIHLNPPKEPPIPSLSATMGLYGKVHFIPQQGFWIASQEDDGEEIPVYVVRKRNLHVITDAVLRARADMDEPVGGNFNFRGVYA